MQSSFLNYSYNFTLKSLTEHNVVGFYASHKLDQSMGERVQFSLHSHDFFY